MWLSIVPHIPKSSRYTLGQRIENKFLDLLEQSYLAYFSSSDKKESEISKSIFSLDIIKFLVSISWEGKILPNKKYEEISIKLDEIGKMMWGWKRSLDKKNPSQNW